MKVRPYGERACLIECESADQRRGLTALLFDEPPPGVLDIVPAEVTVLLRFASTPYLCQFSAAADRWEPRDGVATPLGDLVTVRVRYDGPDLEAVAEETQMSPAELVAWHCGQTWTCDFVGFLPGFGYLVAEDPRQVARRTSPRTRIPTGAVALAGKYSGIYPAESPGGWRLIGSTTPPAPYPAGTRVRFEAVPC